MKKNILILLTFIWLLFSCSITKNQIQKVTPINVLKQLNIWKDSLMKSSTDTVLIYYSSCVGCLDGIADYGYIIWKKHNDCLALKSCSEFISKGYRKSDDVFSFYFQNKAHIDSSNNIAKFESPLLHYRYTETILFIGNEVLLYNKVSDFSDKLKFNLKRNDLLSQWKFMIESNLFKIEHYPYSW